MKKLEYFYNKMNTLKEKIINQTSALFNSHLLAENRQARDMFLTYLDDFLAEQVKAIEGLKKELLDISNPDNYEATYAITGFNDALSKVLSILTKRE